MLLPRDYSYGPGYQSGAMYVIYSRGNGVIKHKQRNDLGAEHALMGPVLDLVKLKHLLKVEVDEEFHTYRIEWTEGK